jgi:hypothetical protein
MEMTVEVRDDYRADFKISESKAVDLLQLIARKDQKYVFFKVYSTCSKTMIFRKIALVSTVNLEWQLAVLQK